jgi:hypothetical protein
VRVIASRKRAAISVSSVSGSTVAMVVVLPAN